MRSSSQGATLPSIDGFIPTPTVIEHEGDSAWLMWDHCVAELDSPADKAAEQLARGK